MNRLPLSLLILARNEETLLARVIRPLRKVAKEILVLDTGSTDRTVAIAKSLGAKVIREKWTGNYAAHRNRLLELATQEWILFLDADQRIAPQDIKNLASLLKKKACAAFYMPHRNYTNDFNLLSGWKRSSGQYRTEEILSRANGYYSDYRPCLFRNGLGIKYEHRIHETIVPALLRLNLKSERSKVGIHHFEFNKGESHHRKKHRRYLRMELSALRRLSPRDPAYFRIMENATVDAIFCGSHLKDAQGWVKRLIRHCPSKSSYWMHAARIEVLNENWTAAKKILKKASLKAPAVDVFCLRAWLFFREGKLNQAESQLRRALHLNPNHLVSLNLKSMILARRKKWNTAIQMLDRTLSLHSTYSDALFNRASLHLAMGNHALATKDLRVLQGQSLPRDLRKDVKGLTFQMRKRA